GGKCPATGAGEGAQAGGESPKNPGGGGKNSAARHFVGRVENGGRGPTRLQRPTGQRQGGKACKVRLLEGQRGRAREIEPWCRPVDSLRPSQAIGNGDAHVRAPQLGNERAATKLNQAVSD